MAFRIKYTGDLARLIKFAGQDRVVLDTNGDAGQFINLLTAIPLLDTGHGHEPVKLGDTVYALANGTFRVEHHISDAHKSGEQSDIHSSAVCRCRACGNQFISATGSLQKYCCRECRPSYSAPIEKHCRSCGKAFTGKSHYCSQACWELAAVSRRRKCMVCGKPADTPYSRYCSDECRELAHIRKHPTHPCIICGAPVSRTNRKTCSPECKREASRRVLATRKCHPTKYTMEYLLEIVSVSNHDRKILKHSYPKEYRFITTHGLLKRLCPPPSYSDEQLAAMSEECGNDYHVFKSRYPKVLDYMRKHKVLKRFLPNCYEYIIWTLPKCAKAAAKCDGRREFFKRYQCAYQSARKHGWLDDLFPMPNKKSGRAPKYTLEYCKALARTCSGPCDLRTHCRGAYESILSHGWQTQIKYDKK